MLNWATLPDGSHPSDIQLAEYVCGRETDESVLLELQLHLESCDECRNRADHCAPDPLQDKIRKFARSGSRTAARLGEGYELVEEVGRGAAGIVYRAFHRSMQRTVALKMLVAGAGASPASLARFKRESEALARMNHPNVVQVFDVGEQDGVPFLAMEWIDGKNLASIIGTGNLSPVQAAKAVLAIARAIGHAHEHGILHRDLKPQNILVPNIDGNFPDRDFTKAGESGFEKLAAALKVVDFGLARFAEESSFQTRTGETLGTPSYMAPEQIHSRPNATGPATDVYGLGAILYECLVGRPPFHGNSPHETIQMVVTHEPANVRAIRPGVPTDLAVICHRCLAKNPNARFQSAGELEADLTRFLEGRPIRSRPIPAWERAVQWTRRNPWPVAVCMVICLAVFATIVVQAVYQQRLTRQRDRAVADYQSARAAIWEILNAANRESDFDIPKLRALRQAQMASALDLFQTFAEHEDTSQAVFDLGQIQTLVGTGLLEVGEFEQGRALLEKARLNLQELVDLSPDDNRTLEALISSQVRLGAALQFHGKTDQAIGVLEATMPMARQLYDRNPDQPGFANLLAWTCHNLANILVEKRNFGEAVRNYLVAVELRERALQMEPDNDDLCRLLVESRISLGMCHMVNQSPEADGMFQKAIESLEEILGRNPKDMAAMVSIAVTCLNRSNIFAANSNLPEAIECCTRGIELVHAVLEVSPGHFEAQNQGSMLYGNRAMFRSHVQPGDSSIADWKMAMEISVVDQIRDFCRSGLIRDLIANRRFPEAMAELHQKGNSENNEQNVFDTAQTWGSIGAAIDNGSEPTGWADELAECNSRALRMLTRLRDSGWLDANSAARETVSGGDDFRALRSTPDGISFLESLEARNPQ